MKWDMGSLGTILRDGLAVAAVNVGTNGNITVLHELVRDANAGAASTPRPAGEAAGPRTELVEWLNEYAANLACFGGDIADVKMLKRILAALQPPSGTGGQAVQAVIDAARKAVDQWYGDGLIPGGAMETLRAASLSTD